MMRTATRAVLARFFLAAPLGLAPAFRLDAQVMDREIHAFLQLDQLEQRGVSGGRPVAWDAIGWIGGDFNRIWLRSTGTRATRGNATDAEFEALFGRLVAPFWDLLIGGQLEARSVAAARRTRGSLVIGLEGLASYWFEVEPTVFISDRGDVSAELNATYELFVTQRLIAQPRVDVRAAAQDVPSFGIGSGLGDAGVGFRLRYEFTRKFAPYVGVRWNRRLGNTADLARAAGEGVGGTVFVSGLRTWF